MINKIKTTYDYILQKFKRDSDFIQEQSFIHQSMKYDQEYYDRLVWIEELKQDLDKLG